MNEPALVAGAALVLAAGVTGIFGRSVMKLTQSGGIKRSAATDLWAAEDRFQARVLGENDRLQSVIDVLRPALAAALASGLVKDTEIVRIRGMLDQAEKSLRELRAEIVARGQVST